MTDPASSNRPPPRQVEAYEAMRDELEHKYPGRWVIISRGRLAGDYASFREADEAATHMGLNKAECLFKPVGPDTGTHGDRPGEETRGQMPDRQRESIRERLKELRLREARPDEAPPDPATFTDAESFVERLPTLLGEIPHISLADDGELNFAWNRGRIYVDLGFYGTGTYSYFARDPEGRKTYGDDVSASGPIPDGLKRILSG